MSSEKDILRQIKEELIVLKGRRAEANMKKELYVARWQKIADRETATRKQYITFLKEKADLEKDCAVTDAIFETLTNILKAAGYDPQGLVGLV